MPRRRRVLGLLLLFALASAGCGDLVRLEAASPVDLPAPQQNTLVLDAAGGVLAELHAEQDRAVVPLPAIPTVLEQAVIAVEDRRFYSHSGVDVRAIARALRANAEEQRLAQGGSTITQQLAKNVVTGPEKTLKRKLAEAALALQLERQLTKDQILERYLNTVYLGNGAYGVQSAARLYFGRDAAQLTLEQSALLAGLLKAPTTYDPYTRPEAARRRRNLVLSLMADQGRISAAEASAARAEPLTVSAPTEERHRAPWFVAHVLEQLQHAPDFAVLGEGPLERAEAVFRGGLRVETTLDPDWQTAADDAATALDGLGDLRTAVVALDPADGSVRVMVGGRDYYDPADPSARFNLATQGLRQPASTFKPLVLAAALARGHHLDEVLPAPATVTLPPRPPAEPDEWVVANYAGTDFGAVSLREATAFSVNVIFAQLIDELGPENIAALATAAGIDRRLPALRSLGLGAVEVTPLQLAAVQATLAAGGVAHRPSAIVRITAADGRVLWERPEPAGERVLDEGVAWLTSSALQDVVLYGTGERADIGRPLAGKTGTSQEGADAWFAGYTPSLAAAVWVGFPQGRVPMKPPHTPFEVEGGNLPAEIFARFARKALADDPAEEFAVPASLVRVRVEAARGCLPADSTPPDLIVERLYLRGAQPTEPCPEPSGPEVTVPDVLNLPVEEAGAALEVAGLVVELSEGCPGGAVTCTGALQRPGRVWEQLPDAGSGVASGSTVTLSAYPPDVAGAGEPVD